MHKLGKVCCFIVNNYYSMYVRLKILPILTMFLYFLLNIWFKS